MTPREKLMQRLGLTEEDFQPKDRTAYIDDALCELAEMLADQENAIVELAELVAGGE